MYIIGFGFIIATPIGVLWVNFSSYGVINQPLFFEYLPGNSSAVEELILDVDFGNIEINYVDPPVNYLAKIDVHIKMMGAGLAGKSYLDFFSINEGDTTGSPISFSMKRLSHINELDLNSLIKNISVIVSLRRDIIFNISTTVINGKVNIDVPVNVRIGNLNVSINNGDILFDLKNCIMDGNITGIGNQSNIELRAREVQYLRNSFWHIKNKEGTLKFDIDQSREMGANVTAIGEVETADAEIQVFYDDFSSDIGAIVTLNHWDEFFPTHCYNFGFDYDVVVSTPETGFRFTSFDFPTQDFYNISLVRKSLDRWRPYFWYLSSEPN